MTRRAIDILTSDALDVDQILPTQFFAPAVEQTAFHSKAHGMMLAMIEYALSEIKYALTHASRRAARLGREAHAWIFTDDEEWPFSFLNCCYQLHIEPEQIRRRVREAHARQRAMYKNWPRPIGRTKQQTTPRRRRSI